MDARKFCIHPPYFQSTHSNPSNRLRNNAQLTSLIYSLATLLIDYIPEREINKYHGCPFFSQLQAAHWCILNELLCQWFVAATGYPRSYQVLVHRPWPFRSRCSFWWRLCRDNLIRRVIERSRRFLSTVADNLRLINIHETLWMARPREREGERGKKSGRNERGKIGYECLLFFCIENRCVGFDRCDSRNGQKNAASF